MATTDARFTDHLTLTFKRGLVPLFFQLLGHGFYVNVQTGCTVKELVCDQLGIHEDYLTQRIQTIFLNGRVVDNVNSAKVHGNATMALSGAMPGLVGAILRSGGFYAPMRSQTSHKKDKPTSQSTDETITLKLMNLVVKELGPTFLQQGIWFKAEELRSFLDRHRESLRTGCKSIEADGRPATPEHLQEITRQAGLVFLQIIAD